MTNAQRQDYLNYFGIPNWLINQSYVTDKHDKVEVKHSYICLIIERTTQQSVITDTKHQELLYKMLSAININSNKVLCINLATTKKTAQEIVHDNLSQAIILLDAQIDLVNKEKVFYLPHPQQLFDNIKLKREAWHQLKQLKQFLNLSNG